jgi:hypothetical protein
MFYQNDIHSVKHFFDSRIAIIHIPKGKGLENTNKPAPSNGGEIIKTRQIPMNNNAVNLAV